MQAVIKVGKWLGGEKSLLFSFSRVHKDSLRLEESGMSEDAKPFFFRKGWEGSIAAQTTRTALLAG